MRLKVSQLRQLIIEVAKTVSSLPTSVKFFEVGEAHTHYMYLLDDSLMPNISEALLGGISISSAGGAWHVGSVSAYEGYGPLLYRLAMEWVAQEGGGRGLTKNPGETSKAAQRVWDRFSSIKRDPEAAIQSLPVDDPMRPEYVAKSNELKKIRTRWIQLTPAQANEAWSELIDLNIGGQRGYDDD